MAFLEVASGAVLGGALALGTTSFFEQRRERREDAREQAALKAAARIAYTDMGVRRNLRQAVKEGLWYSFMEIPLSGWQQQGHRLAGSLPPQDYDRVAQAFARAGDLERGFRQLVSKAAGGAAQVVPLSLNTELGPPVRDLLDQVDESCQILGRLSYEGDDGEGSRVGWEAHSHYSEIAAATRSAGSSSDCGRRCTYVDSTVFGSSPSRAATM